MNKLVLAVTILGVVFMIAATVFSYLVCFVMEL